MLSLDERWHKERGERRWRCAELAERRQRLTEQGQLLRARVQEIAQQRRDRAAELHLLEGVDAFCASIRDAMVAPSFEVK